MSAGHGLGVPPTPKTYVSPSFLNKLQARVVRFTSTVTLGALLAGFGYYYLHQHLYRSFSGIESKLDNIAQIKTPYQIEEEITEQKQREAAELERRREEAEQKLFIADKSFEDILMLKLIRTWNGTFKLIRDEITNRAAHRLSQRDEELIRKAQREAEHLGFEKGSVNIKVYPASKDTQ